MIMLDVLVIGAGPTGLLMAAECARFKMQCRIVDKSTGPALQSRALAIQPRTLELFDHLGIVDEFLAKGLKVRAANPFSGKERLARISFETLQSDYPFILSLEQSETERILIGYLSRLGVSVERETELMDIRQTSDKVVALLRDNRSGKEETVEAKWAVGCDGAHSAVRKAVGIPFAGKPFHNLFSLADVQIDWNFPHEEVFLFLNRGGLLGAIPMPGLNRYRLVYQSGRDPDFSLSGSAPTFQEVQSKVWETVGGEVTVSHPLWLADFHINSRLVKNYRKGRIFLAGDAAHIHSPAGGQGMNSGLQDAFNLAWKLADGRENILETYNLERRSWGKDLVLATRWATKLVTLRNPIAIALRNWAIAHLVPKFQPLLIRALSQTAIRYPKSIIASEKGHFAKGPKAGTRAPNAPVGHTDIYSLLRKTTGWHLLLFGEFGPVDFPGLAVHSIHDEKAKEIYGVEDRAAYLIRPDQTIAFRCLDRATLDKFLKAVRD